MLQRSLTGAAFLIILLGAIFAGPYTFSALFFLIPLLGLREFYNLAEKTGHSPQKLLGFLIGSLLSCAVLFYLSSSCQHLAVIPFSILLPALFSLFIFELYRKKENPFGNIGYTVIAVLYVSLPFALLSTMAFDYTESTLTYHYVPHKIAGLFFILWSSDTGAYLAGKTFGKHKLFARISPGKTWEGTIGGGIFALGISWIVSLFYKELTQTDWMVMAVIIVVMGNLGDLVESILKRSADEKDSGSILPGHGGILDRFDSLILSAPFIFTYLHLIKP